MRLSSQEELGLRCLLRVAARAGTDGCLTITDISEAEGLSTFYVGKIMRLLRQAGFVKSTRGQEGGYRLVRPASEITVAQVLAALDGRLFEEDFCDHHTGVDVVCANKSDCSIRALWRTVQFIVDGFLGKVTLQDLEGHDEQAMAPLVTQLVKIQDAERARQLEQLLHTQP